MDGPHTDVMVWCIGVVCGPRDGLECDSLAVSRSQLRGGNESVLREGWVVDLGRPSQSLAHMDSSLTVPP